MDINLKQINLKQIFSENNKTKLIGVLTILIALWILLYLIPDILYSLFNTFLGNIILLLTIILVSSFHAKYGFCLALLIIIIMRYSYLFKQQTKENFTWNNESTNKFLLIQNTKNRGIVFDTNVIQESQSSQEEVDYFNEHGYWPWSTEVIELYEEAISKNPYVRSNGEDSTNYARRIYNEAAILRILAMQSKEGQFLINGVKIPNTGGNPNEELPSGFGKFGYKSGLISNLSDDVIKCKSDNSGLERITYTGKDGIFGQQTKKITDVDNNELQEVIPGFKFINETCNPCKSLNQTADYSCPFELKVKNEEPISKVWKYLWNI